MSNELTEEIIEKMYEVGVGLNMSESLSRILLDCIDNGDNLKACDIENLSSILEQKIIQTKEKFNSIENIFGI